MNRRQTILAAAALAAITVLVYLPAMRNGFVWDDREMAIDNPLVKSAGGLGEIWLGKNLPEYHPLTYSVFWLEWRLWGANPAGWHVINILLHAADVALLWLVLRKLRVPGSWLAALLFGAHPVCAASAAWPLEPTQMAPDSLTMGMSAEAKPPATGSSVFARATRFETTTTLTANASALPVATTHAAAVGSCVAAPQ